MFPEKNLSYTPLCQCHVSRAGDPPCILCCSAAKVVSRGGPEVLPLRIHVSWPVPIAQMPQGCSLRPCKWTIRLVTTYNACNCRCFFWEPIGGENIQACDR